MSLFRDRRHAGQVLASELARAPEVDLRQAAVLALPRGGVPVAVELAAALDAPLDVLVVRKLGIPWEPELAFGALGPGGECYIDEESLKTVELSAEELEGIVASARRELERRERAYRGNAFPVPLQGKTAVLVDDGLATGASMTVAARAARKAGARRAIVAVPVGSPDACEALRREADAVVCAVAPRPFVSVGVYYDDFRQLTDEEVCRDIERSRRVVELTL